MKATPARFSAVPPSITVSLLGRIKIHDMLANLPGDYVGVLIPAYRIDSAIRLSDAEKEQIGFRPVGVNSVAWNPQPDGVLDAKVQLDREDLLFLQRAITAKERQWKAQEDFVWIKAVLEEIEKALPK